MSRFNREDNEVAASSPFRLGKLDILGGDGVDIDADDWAVVLDELDGTRNPGRPGVVEKLASEPSDMSWCVLLVMSGCVAKAADMVSNGNYPVRTARGVDSLFNFESYR